jgi:hypothetical protein
MIKTIRPGMGSDVPQRKIHARKINAARTENKGQFHC